jgi:hypothetical protein
MLQYTKMDSSIELDTLKQLQRFKNAPPHPAYIAGMIDGDGCIFIRKILHGYQSGITITQCRSNILRVIRYHFGGSITTSANRNNKVVDKLDETGEFYHKHNVRNQYNLILRSNEYKLLLDYIRFSMIIKQPQIECLNDFYKLADIPNVVEEKEILYKKCSDINKDKMMDESTLGRMNIEYIEGLLDAEGCFYINKSNIYKFYIGIAQKNHPVILEKIKQFLGFGHIEENINFIINKKQDCLKFIALVKNGLIVKYNQVLAFETYLTTSDVTVKQEMYKICNEEKHKIEQFNDVNCNADEKEGYLELMRLREMKEKVCKQIHFKQVYKEKSEKMQGAGNHNFGKLKSAETKKKMSTSIRDAKGGVSDDIILKVRALIAEGKKNMEIQELLTLSRHIVTRIKNGNTLCRTEEKQTDPKIPLSKEAQNIKKRKIHLEEMCIVIEKLVKEEKPMAILEHLDALRLKQQIKNDLSIDIVKNIKRNINQGELPFYKSEVSPEKYEHYLQLIGKYKKK